MPQPINISASRGAAVLGLSKWKTPVEIWLEIMEAREPEFCESNNYDMPEPPDNASIRWGKAFESAIIELAERKTKNGIFDREMFFESGYLTCHIDGRYSIVKSGKELHEGKTTTIYSFNNEWGEPGTDRVPTDVQIQCQHQMICTGAAKVIPSVLVFPKRPEEWEEMGMIPGSMLNGGYRFTGDYQNISIVEWARTLAEMGYFHQYEIKADVELHAAMIEYYHDFWHNHILKKVAPRIDQYNDFKRLIREPSGTIVATEQMERWAAEYDLLKGEEGEIKKRKDQLKTLQLKAMRDAENTMDDDSKKKWILRSREGKKLHTYGMNEKGGMYFR